MIEAVGKLMDSAGMSLSSSEQIARKLLQDSQKTKDNERKSLANQRQEIYDNFLNKHIRVALQRRFAKENYQRLKPWVADDYNLLKRIVDDVSLVYHEPAKRETEGPGNAAYQDLLSLMSINDNMGEAERMLYNHKILFLMPVVSGDGPSIDLIQPGIVNVATNPHDPRTIQAMTYGVNAQDIGGMAKKFVQYWDDFNEFVMDEDGHRVPNPENPEGKNKFGVIPIVTARAEVNRVGEFWPVLASYDLVSATLLIGVLRSYLAQAVKICSYKQPYVTGSIEGIPDDMILDPTTFLAARDASFGTLDMQINLDAISKVISDIIDGQAVANNISPESFKMSAAPTSAQARKLANEARDNHVARMRNTMRRVEKDLYKMMAHVYNFHDIPGVGYLNPDEQFKINFADITYDEAESVQYAQDKLLQADDMLKKSDNYRKYVDSDAGDDDAVLEILQANRDYNVKARQIGVDAIQGGVLPPIDLII